MSADRPLKRKLSGICDADRIIYATAFQGLPPSEAELKGILEGCCGVVSVIPLAHILPKALTALYGISERIARKIDTHGAYLFRIVFATADGAAKAIERGALDLKYGMMMRRVICVLRRECPSQTLQSPESLPAPTVTSPGSSPMSPITPPIDPRRPNGGTSQTHPPIPQAKPAGYDNGVRPHLPTLLANCLVRKSSTVETPIHASSSTSPTPNLNITTSESADEINITQLTSEISALKVMVDSRDNEISQLRKKLENANADGQQQKSRAVEDAEYHKQLVDTLTSEATNQFAEIARLNDEVSLLKARESQAAEDRRAIQATMERRVARVHSLTRRISRMRGAHAKLAANNTMAKRHLRMRSDELRATREASDRLHRGSETLQNEFDAYKKDQLRIGTQFEQDHKELLRAHAALQEEHKTSLNRSQATLDECSEHIAFLEGQRQQGVARMNDSNRHINMLQATLSMNEQAAAGTREQLSCAEQALIKLQGEYERKCTEANTAGHEITRLVEALAFEKRTHDDVVQKFHASEAKTHQERLAERQGYETQLSRASGAYDHALFEARKAACGEASSKEAALSELDTIRREMGDKMTLERDAFASALTRVQGNLHNTMTLLDIKHRNYISLQEAHIRLTQSLSKPIVRVDRTIQTEPVTEAPTLQKAVEPPHILSSLLQAYATMLDIGISVTPNAANGLAN